MKSSDGAPTPIIVLMGVSGVGKTEIGRRLAQRLDWSFVDADTFHSSQNMQKMSAGQPLSDEDRHPWLVALRTHLRTNKAAGKPTVLACSALKGEHRALLRENLPGLRFVYLEGNAALIAQRLEERQDHFFDPALLQSQLDTLEPPCREEAIALSIEPDPEAIVNEICLRLVEISPFFSS